MTLVQVSPLTLGMTESEQSARRVRVQERRFRVATILRERIAADWLGGGVLLIFTRLQ